MLSLLRVARQAVHTGCRLHVRTAGSLTASHLRMPNSDALATPPPGLPTVRFVDIAHGSARNVSVRIANFSVDYPKTQYFANFARAFKKFGHKWLSAPCVMQHFAVPGPRLSRRLEASLAAIGAPTATIEGVHLRTGDSFDPNTRPGKICPVFKYLLASCLRKEASAIYVASDSVTARESMRSAFEIAAGQNLSRRMLTSGVTPTHSVKCHHNPGLCDASDSLVELFLLTRLSRVVINCLGGRVFESTFQYTMCSLRRARGLPPCVQPKRKECLKVKHNASQGANAVSGAMPQEQCPCEAVKSV